jgi:iron complex outermembrane receptor protein
MNLLPILLHKKADDDEIRTRGLTRDDFNFQIGDAQIRQGQLF